MALPDLTIKSATVVADPELRYTPGGTAVANFRVACNQRRYDEQAREWVDGETTFLTCNAWKQLGENAAATLRKGMAVNVTGRLKQRSYQTREGEDRTVYEVDVDEVSPSLKWATAEVERNQRGGGGQQTAAQKQSAAQQQPDPWNSTPSGPVGDEEPPF